MSHRAPDCRFLDFTDYIPDDTSAHLPDLVLYVLQVFYAPGIFGYAYKPRLDSAAIPSDR